MSTNLPTGGKSQPNSAPTTQAPTATDARVVRVERLQKMSAEQLEAKIANLPTKIKRKEDATAKRITQLRSKLTAYTDFKRQEAEVCKRLLAERKKAASAPNAASAKAA